MTSTWTDPEQLSVVSNSSVTAKRSGKLCLLNNKQRRTLAAVFTDPVSGTIKWAAAKRYQVRAARAFLQRIGATP